MMFFCHVGIVQIKGTNILEQRFLLSLSMRACKAEAEVTYHVLMRQEQTKVSMHALGFSAEFQHRIAMYVFFTRRPSLFYSSIFLFKPVPGAVQDTGHRTQDGRVSRMQIDTKPSKLAPEKKAGSRVEISTRNSKITQVAQKGARRLPVQGNNFIREIPYPVMECRHSVVV